MQVRDNVDRLVLRLRQLQHTADEYSAMARSRPRSALSRAVRFIYLNRTSWNGLYRVNSEGRFNVPIGRHKYPQICDEPLLRSASAALAGAQLSSGDFEERLTHAKSGDFVYLDPPYATSANNSANGFTSYNSKLFSLADQERLARIAHGLVQKGCHVVVSNTAHSSIDALYSGFHRIDLLRASRIAGSMDRRRTVVERLFTSFAPDRTEIDQWQISR